MSQAVINDTGIEDEFTLDVRVVETGVPVPGLQRSTSDNCGSTCDGTACTSNLAHPS